MAAFLWGTKYLTVTFKMRPLSGQNISSLFKTSISSVKSEIQDDKPKKKSKQLRISFM